MGKDLLFPEQRRILNRRRKESKGCKLQRSLAAQGKQSRVGQKRKGSFPKSERGLKGRGLGRRPRDLRSPWGTSRVR